MLLEHSPIINSGVKDIVCFFKTHLVPDGDEYIDNAG